MRLLGPPGGLLSASWEPHGVSWGLVRALSWSRLGGLLSRIGGLLGRLVDIFDLSHALICILSSRASRTCSACFVLLLMRLMLLMLSLVLVLVLVLLLVAVVVAVLLVLLLVLLMMQLLVLLLSMLLLLPMPLLAVLLLVAVPTPPAQMAAYTFRCPCRAFQSPESHPYGHP